MILAPPCAGPAAPARPCRRRPCPPRRSAARACTGRSSCRGLPGSGRGRVVTEPVGAGRFMKSPAPSMARSRSSTSARSAGSAAHASLRKADRSAGASISRARPKIDFTSGLVALIVWSSGGMRISRKGVREARRVGRTAGVLSLTSPTQCDVRGESLPLSRFFRVQSPPGPSPPRHRKSQALA